MKYNVQQLDKNGKTFTNVLSTNNKQVAYKKVKELRNKFVLAKIEVVE